ncbi:MAG: 2-isopropylmalate synthase [Firmicutes bacterium]|nr:2-isopropylmalate synthase [Bacillota bacterium]
MKETVKIFDTTLRDGEQSPGVALTGQEKLAVAEQLSRLGVDIIEAGFPQSSQGDFDAVRSIAQNVVGPTIAGLARCNQVDVVRTAEALEPAQRPRIHVFIATSPIHMRSKLRMSPEEVLDRVGSMVALARTYCDDVEFSAEDATRSEIEFLSKVAQIAAQAGARTINLPDTVGYTTPAEYYALVQAIRKAVPDPAVTLSVHCHNDLGLAVANTLSGIEAGCRQVEVAINGIGERAGNAALEEVVMALTARADVLKVGHQVDTKEIYRASQMVSRLTGMSIQFNKAIVGRNAFRHESGIHQDGMLKDRNTYEILSPESIGLGSTILVLGKHSGRHALRQRLDELGLTVTPEQLDQIQQRIKVLAEEKTAINDQDLEAIWQGAVGAGSAISESELLSWQVTTGTQVKPTAHVVIRVRDMVREDSGSGDGPVHALFQALTRAFEQSDVELSNYQLVPVSPGEGGLATVRVEVVAGSQDFSGQATDSDVLRASAFALHQALSRVAEHLTKGVVA